MYIEFIFITLSDPNKTSVQKKHILGCPWKLVDIVSKLGYNLYRGLTTYLYWGYNLVTKYHGHPSPHLASLKMARKTHGSLACLPAYPTSAGHGSRSFSRNLGCFGCRLVGTRTTQRSGRGGGKSHLKFLK